MRCHKVLRRAVFLLTMTLFYTAAYAQNSTQVLVKGIISDKYTSSPVGIDFDVKPANGNKFKGKSNSLDGGYELLLNSGETYVITPMGNDILREEITITVKDASAFTEQKTDLQVRKLKPGTVLFTETIFSGNAISEQGRKFLEEFKSILRFNRYVSFELSVGGKDAAARLAALKEYTADWKAFAKRISLVSGGSGADLTIKVSSIEEPKTN